MLSQHFSEPKLTLEFALVPVQLKFRIVLQEDLGLNSYLQSGWDSQSGNCSVKSHQVSVAMVQHVCLDKEVFLRA